MTHRSNLYRQPRPVSLLALVLLTTSLASAQQEPEDPGSYMGRDIAHVMSFQGAPWLEREERPQEEDTDQLMSLLPIEPGDTVVDLGCGSGYFARRMSSLVGPEGNVLCVDIQPEMLQIARTLAKQNDIRNLSTVLSTPDDPKLPEGEIDLILLVDVYHEMTDPASMLAHMREALSPTGVVALVEFRLEGETASHIKIEHRMSVEQVEKEWLSAGYELVKLHESLPTQHLFLFRAPEQP